MTKDLRSYLIEVTAPTISRPFESRQFYVCITEKEGLGAKGSCYSSNDKLILSCASQNTFPYMMLVDGYVQHVSHAIRITW